MTGLEEMFPETFAGNSRDNYSRHQTGNFLEMICASKFEYSTQIRQLARFRNCTIIHCHKQLLLQIRYCNISVLYPIRELFLEQC